MRSCENAYANLGRRQIAVLLFLMFLVSAALRCFGFIRVYRLLRRLADRADTRSCSAGQRTEAKAAARELRQVNQGFSILGNDCLAESLVLWWLLARRGIDARLKIGVRTLTGTFESHAWVVFGGLVLNEEADVENVFTAFDLRAMAGV